MKGRCPGCCGTGRHDENCLMMAAPEPLVPETVDQLPTFEDVPDERPQVTADAELVLPTEIFAPWFRAIQRWLEKAGAKAGVDYRSVVSSAGMDDKKRWLFKVQWRAATERGVLYLNLMATSLRALAAEPKQVAWDQGAENAPKSPENR